MCYYNTHVAYSKLSRAPVYYMQLQYSTVYTGIGLKKHCLVRNTLSSCFVSNHSLEYWLLQYCRTGHSITHRNTSIAALGYSIDIVTAAAVWPLSLSLT